MGSLPPLRIDRTGAAIVGAILMVALGGLPFDAAATSIDYRTLVLLFGMMVIIANLRLARFFRTLARGAGIGPCRTSWRLPPRPTSAAWRRSRATRRTC